MGANSEKNRAAVQQLIVARGTQLRQFVLAHLSNHSEVQDVLQDIYLRYLQVPHVESIRSPEAYLFTIARHVIQQHGLRHRAAAPTRTDLSELLADSPAEPAFDPTLQFAAEQTAERLESALNLLSAKCRAVFLLHRRDGLSIDEISTRLGISKPMVKKYLFRTLLRLRQQLSSTD